jgi:alkanesulfonate monooxygenase
VLDENLSTAPAGSAADVAASLRKYEALGVTCFVLSDTPCPRELERQGDQLLPLLRG